MTWRRHIFLKYNCKSRGMPPLKILGSYFYVDLIDYLKTILNLEILLIIQIDNLSESGKARVLIWFSEGF